MVKKGLLFAFIVTVLLFQSGCPQSTEAWRPPQVSPSEVPASRMLTLSQQQLISLDWNNSNRMGARVTAKRIVPDSGVEFDVFFPNNSPGYRSVDYVSSGRGGLGTMVGVDVSGYESYALVFTLVSINGQTGAELAEKVEVGAVIGLTSRGRYSEYEPVTLSMAPAEKSAIGKTIMHTDKIYQIGFHIAMLNPEQWRPDSSTVTLRVQPAEFAGPVPWHTLGRNLQ
jgi:hypothetical protein